jgi:plastocyanin domain-containing protein
MKGGQKDNSISDSEEKAKIFIFSSIVMILTLAIGAFVIISLSSKKETAPTTITEISENGNQLITINAKGGYSPSSMIAKANTPTLLRFATQNTFDCSTSLVINQLGISKNLPATGNTDIEVPAQASGSVLKGSCSMGMYSFSIKFN